MRRRMTHDTSFFVVSVLVVCVDSTAGCGNTTRPAVRQADGGSVPDASDSVPDAEGDVSDATDREAAADAGSTATPPGGRLLLNIGGTSQGTTYDSLNVAGSATLGGELDVTFTPPFVPTSGQKFVLVTATGGIRGSFQKVTTTGATVTTGQDANTFFVTVQ